MASENVQEKSIMDAELKILTAITKKLPRWKVLRIIVNRAIVPFYRRKNRAICVAEVNGLIMELDPAEFIDAALLFLPQMYDADELDTLKTIVKEDWSVVDIGAHIGYYSLTLANLLSQGSVLAIEAAPSNAIRFERNVMLNPKLKKIKLMVNGVSDKTETLSMGISTTGNTSGNSFLSGSATRIDVTCKPLLELINEAGIDRIDFMKMDIEGFEFRVLNHFFQYATIHLYPRWILIEDNPTLAQEGNIYALLIGRGYKVVRDFGLNKLYAFS
jgi:FkbM family methyltransferase